VIFVSPAEIECAIKELDLNKSCGMDGVYAEHLKYSSRRLLVLLSVCITSMFIHGVLPESMISVVLVPIIKDKTGKITSKDNYRPIALASTISKIIEIILLNRMSDLLLTCHNQFGFKKKLGTDQCIYMLKEIIDAYKVLNGSIFICFLDASKAFDRVNHNTLFKKLLSRGVPCYIVRILAFWYANQTNCVRWGGVYSDSFNVSNGVRQGGILSPFLFNVYIDDLSCRLNDCRTGCSFAGMLINHLMYADDLVLIAPSTAGLQKLLNLCEKYGVDHDVKYNAKKSAVMVFRSRLLHNVVLPSFKLNGVNLNTVRSVKYLGHLQMI